MRRAQMCAPRRVISVKRPTSHLVIESCPCDVVLAPKRVVLLVGHVLSPQPLELAGHRIIRISVVRPVLGPFRPVPVFKRSYW